MEDWYTRGENAFLKAYGRYDVVLEKVKVFIYMIQMDVDI